MYMKHYIVTTGGGLGNQIMQYALWSHFKSEGISTSLVLRRNDIGWLFPSLDIPMASVFDRVFVKVRDYIRFIYDGVNWIKEGKRLKAFPIVLTEQLLTFHSGMIIPLSIRRNKTLLKYWLSQKTLMIEI